MFSSIGLLWSLKTIKVRGLDGIVSIDAEFSRNNSSFASLERLEFNNIKECKEWECKTPFPRLQHLSFYQCPKVKRLPNQLLHLKELKIHYCDKVVISENNLDTLSLKFWEFGHVHLWIFPWPITISLMEIDGAKI